MKPTSAKKGLIYLAVAQLVMMGAGFLIHFWVGRYLGPESYGIYGIVLALMGVFNLFLVWGVPRAFSKYLPKNEKAHRLILKKGLLIQLFFGIILGAFYFLASPLLVLLLNDKTLMPYIQFSALVLPAYALFSIYVGYFNGLRLFGIQSFLTIFYSLVKMVSAIGLIYVFRIYGAFAGFIIAPLVTFFIAFPFSFKKSLPQPSKEKDFPTKKLIAFALPFIGLAVLLYIQREIGLLLVKSFLKDNVTTGYYNAANTVAKIPYFFLEALALLALPVVVKTFASKKIQEAKGTIKRMISLLFIILTPAVFLSYFTREEALEFLYGKAYLKGSYIFPFLVLSFSILTLFFILANIFAAIKSPATPFKVSILMVILNVAIAFYLIPEKHMAGAAFATLFSAAVGTLIMAVILFNKIGPFVNVRFAAKIILIAFGATIIALFLDLPLWLLPFEYVALLAFYGLLLWLFKEIKKEDMLVLKDIILFRKD